MPHRSLRRSIIAASITLALAPGTGHTQIEEVIVTAQKRAESAQDVPIAITAFDDAALKAKQITTFGDMRFAAPNVGFAKGNFSGNNFQIRGIGTSLVAAGSDDGVGIHVNEVPILYPRLFETEYYDVQQLAILRGPQGTLYGRNSTGGAVNMITNTPHSDGVDGHVEAQYGDYDHAKIDGAINIPLGDSLAVRFAGLMLQRDGYTENVYTGEDIDDRDQYSVRGSLRWTPGDNTTIDLMVSYFDEDSSRTRSQKQMCKNDPSALLGCLPDELAFETVNPLAQLTGMLPARLGPLGPQPALTNSPSENPRDMREVIADFDPVYEADETLVTLRIAHEFERYSFAAIAGYQDTSVLSQQDYNWNVSGPASVSPLVALIAPQTFARYFADGCLPISAPSANANGIIGGHIGDCNSRLDGYDQSNQETDQTSLEMHLASNYDGPLNFLLGAFYMTADTFNEYWVIASGLDYFSVVFPAVPVGFGGPVGVDGLAYTAPSFVNRTNAYELESKALFGELYYQITDELKLTLGARYTIDEKDTDDVSYLFNSFVPFGFDGTITGAGGAPLGRIDGEKWEETTGRVVLDWSPEVSFTDSTLVYASYSRGYKGGGFNPPFDAALFPDTAATYEPEFVNAFEIGTKNQLLDNRLQANLTAFFYDYEGLQVSKIVNRTSFKRKYRCRNLRHGSRVPAPARPALDAQCKLRLPAHRGKGLFLGRYAGSHRRALGCHADQGQPECLELRDHAQRRSRTRRAATQQLQRPGTVASGALHGQRWRRRGSLRQQTGELTGNDHKPGRAIHFLPAPGLPSGRAARLLLAGRDVRSHLQSRPGGPDRFLGYLERTGDLAGAR
jgi:iron complex outermembrane recepter protein